jgi:hypothetical protein
MSNNDDLLASVSDVSTASEFFSPVPTGYKKGKTCDGIDTPEQYAEFVKRMKHSSK